MRSWYSPSAGAFGSEMYTDCMLVMICFRLILRYGWTIGSPSGVVHTTAVICSLRRRVVTARFLDLDRSSSIASTTRSPGTDLEITRAEAVSQFMMSFAPWNKSPMHCNTWDSACQSTANRIRSSVTIPAWRGISKQGSTPPKEHRHDLSAAFRSDPVRQRR